MASLKDMRVRIASTKATQKITKAMQIVEVIELRSVRTLGFVNAESVAQRILTLFEEGAFDVATLFFSRFRSVIAQVPTAQQIIPPMFAASGEGKESGAAATYEYEPEE